MTSAILDGGSGCPLPAYLPVCLCQPDSLWARPEVAVAASVEKDEATDTENLPPSPIQLERGLSPVPVSIYDAFFVTQTLYPMDELVLGPKLS